jgi:hypothetical protein
MEKDKRFYHELNSREMRIKEIKSKLNSSRGTGRSCRMLNDYIERFFREPMGLRQESINIFKCRQK